MGSGLLAAAWKGVEAVEIGDSFQRPYVPMSIVQSPVAAIPYNLASTICPDTPAVASAGSMRPTISTFESRCRKVNKTGDGFPL